MRRERKKLHPMFNLENLILMPVSLRGFFRDREKLKEGIFLRHHHDHHHHHRRHDDVTRIPSYVVVFVQRDVSQTEELKYEKRLACESKDNEGEKEKEN